MAEITLLRKKIIRYSADGYNKVVRYKYFDDVICKGSFAYSNLKRVFIPDTITAIFNSAFYKCDNLTSIDIPYQVNIIDTKAFYACTNLATVKVRAKVPPILGDGAFKYYNNGEKILPNLTAIYVPEESVDVYKAAEGWSDYASIIQPAKDYIKVVLNVTDGEIDTPVADYNARFNASCIEVDGNYISITDGAKKDFLYRLSSGLHTIKYYSIYSRATVIDSALGVFGSSANVDSIELPDTITTIGNSTFGGVTPINSINLGNSITTIGNYAFYSYNKNKQFTSIVFPATVTSIGDSAFSSNCPNLTTITVEAITPPTLGDNYSLPPLAQLEHIYVPADSVATYKAASIWKNYKNIISAIPEE